MTGLLSGQLRQGCDAGPSRLAADLLAECRLQQAALYDLRGQLAARSDEAQVAEFPVETLDFVLTCLERAMLSHAETLQRILEQTGNPSRPASLAPPMRRLHAEHEAILGLLAFAQRTCAGFVCAEDASILQRALYPVLALWDGRQRALQRRETCDLVPAALSTDPALGPLAQPDTLPIRRVDTLSPTGCVSELDVFCPAERRSVGVEWCRTCPVVRHVGIAAVQCLPGVEEAPLPVGARLGEAVSVGATLSRRHLRVMPGVAVEAIVDALDRTPAAAAVVVDESGHLLGILSSAAVRSAPPDGQAEEFVGPGLSVNEAASLADAAARMVHAHARVLAVTGEDQQVIGVLEDLDLLRWVARRPRQP